MGPARALVAAALLGAAPDAGTLDAGTPAGAPDAGASIACPPAERAAHCVYLTLWTPSTRPVRELLRKLKQDGVAAVSEESVVSMTLDDEQIRSILGAKVRYRLTAASASNRMLCTAELVRGRTPLRYQEVRSARIDPQCP